MLASFTLLVVFVAGEILRGHAQPDRRHRPARGIRAGLFRPTGEVRHDMARVLLGLGVLATLLVVQFGLYRVLERFAGDPGRRPHSFRTQYHRGGAGVLPGWLGSRHVHCRLSDIRENQRPDGEHLRRSPTTISSSCGWRPACQAPSLRCCALSGCCGGLFTCGARQAGARVTLTSCWPERRASLSVWSSPTRWTIRCARAP